MCNVLNLYSYSKLFDLKHFLEKKKHEPNSKKYSSEIITKQVKTHKRKHKNYNDDNTSDGFTSDDNPTQHGIKLLVSFDNFKNFGHLHILYLD